MTDFNGFSEIFPKEGLFSPTFYRICTMFFCIDVAYDDSGEDEGRADEYAGGQLFAEENNSVERGHDGLDGRDDGGLAAFDGF